jgi:hypothetical protein
MDAARNARRVLPALSGEAADGCIFTEALEAGLGLGVSAMLMVKTVKAFRNPQ